MKLRTAGLWMMLFALAAAAPAQTTIPAVVLSDLHFDPFHDPGKVERLIAAPLAQWDAILSEPDTAGAADSFAALQKTCGARGADTPYPLLASSLAGMRSAAAGARFVMVTGDMLVHVFGCRYEAVVHPGQPADPGRGADFAAKTANFVMARIESAFPGLPVYFTLGNNDVDCGNNRLDIADPFFAATAKAMLAGLPGVRQGERRALLREYLAGGRFSLKMAAPMQNTRLIEIDDLYLVDFKYYANCSGAKDGAGAAQTLAWLTEQLDGARRRGEKVWVLAHIPPGIDEYGTFSTMKDVCQGGETKLFLASDELGAVLERYPDVVKLVLSGHSHNDEFRVLRGERGDIPLKMFGSISPINGNNPSFTLVKIDPAAAGLADYTVYVGSNKTGVDTKWQKEYSFDESYGKTSVSAAALEAMTTGFRADPDGATPASQRYETFYFPPGTASPLEPVWSRYACMLDHDTAAGYRDCACAQPPR